MNMDFYDYIAIINIRTADEQKNSLGGLLRIMYVRGGSYAGVRRIWYL